MMLAAVQGPANAELFEGLLMLQHRGQDSAGMVTYDNHRFCEHKGNGLVNDVFGPKMMKKLRGDFRRLIPILHSGARVVGLWLPHQRYLLCALDLCSPPGEGRES